MKGIIETEINKYYFKPKSFWDLIPKPVHDDLKAHSTINYVGKNELIYSEGTYPKGLYIIRKGVAKMYIISATGEEQIIYILSDNEMFGYRAIACNSNSVIFISAIEDCEIEMVDRDIFISLLFGSMELNKIFMNYLGAESQVLFNKIAVFSLKPVTERVALTLLALNQKLNSGKESEHYLAITHKDLANYTGVKIETFSRQLRILKNLKALTTKGRKIKLIDFDILIERANI